MPGKVYLCVCQNIEKEARAVLARGDRDFDGVELVVFPGRCGRPALSDEELRRLVPEDAALAEVVGSACLSTLRRIPANATRAGVTHVGHCFHMFADHELIEQLLSAGDYLLTPGWLVSWRERIACWGFSDDDLRGFLRETVVRLHLLDTGVDAESSGRLLEFSRYVRREQAITWVGLDFFALVLRTVVLRARLGLEATRGVEVARTLNRRTADYAMALDLLGRLSTGQDEQETIEQILEVFTMLFAPLALSYVAYEQGEPLTVYQINTPIRAVDDRIRQLLEGCCAKDAEGKDSECILAPIAHARQIFGVVVVEQIAFPGYGSHYRPLIDAISPICGLSISNARSYQELRLTGEALQGANQELSRLATIDGLTQLANRRHFDERLDAEWRRARRQSAHISLIMIDIDHFKAFNDRHGHPAGDSCLRDVALVLSSCLTRAGDLAARFGGEEFAVILPNTAVAGVSLLAERIREAVLGSRIEHGASPVGPYVTLSVGHATTVPDLRASVKDLVRVADQALYEAKRLGRNRCCRGA